MGKRRIVITSVPKYQSGGFHEKYSKMLQAANKDLQAMYPGRKVEVREVSGYRKPETQRGIVKKGASTTDVSLHGINAAKDYQIYVDGKAIKTPKIYHDILWKNAERAGLYHLDPKGFGAVDLGHIGVIEEDSISTYGRLIDQYPDIVNTPEYKAQQKYLASRVSSGIATPKEQKVYNQMMGQRYIPQLWYKPMYPIEEKEQVIVQNKIPKEQIKNIPTAKVNNLPTTAEVITLRKRKLPENVVQNNTEENIQIEPVAINNNRQLPIRNDRVAIEQTEAPEYKQNIQSAPISIYQSVLDEYKNKAWSERPKMQSGGKLKNISPEDAAISNYLMQKNRGMNWVDRAYDPNRKKIGNSTHLMEWSDDGIQGYVYPTIVEQSGQLQNIGSDAYNHAMRTGEYIPVPMNKAQMFSEYGYKHAAGIPVYKNGGTMKKRIQITSAPRYDTEGQWASQVGPKYQKELYTPWPLAVNQQTVSDPQYGMKETLQPVPREYSDIEAEKGEQIIGDFDSDGAPESMTVGGKRHSEGGTPLSVPDNSFVYSDTKKLRIKDPNILAMFGGGKSKTPAELAKKYKLNEYKSLMDNPDTDPMTRKTAEMMYQNNLKKLLQVAAVQEQLKTTKGIPANPQQPVMAYGGGNKRANPDGTIDHIVPSQYPTVGNKKRVVITSTPGGNPMNGTDISSLGINNYWDQVLPTPTPGNMQQGLNEPTIGDGPKQMAASPGAIDPRMVNIPAYTPVIPKGTNKMNKFLAGAKDSMGAYRGLSADTIGDIALGIKALTTRKYSPWEPAVQAVYPEFIPESDQPIRNVLSEATNTIQQGMYSGDTKRGRAAANIAQGQLLSQAAQAVGQVSNRNAIAANRYSEQVANITNERLAQERERAKRLYDNNIISAQEYQNSLNNISNEIAAREMAEEQKASERAWINKTSPYFTVDKRGMPVFKSQEAKARFESEVLNGRGGEGISANYTAIVQQLTDSGMSRERAEDLAEDIMRKQVGLGNKTTTTTKQGNKTIKQTQSKYGGILSYLK